MALHHIIGQAGLARRAGHDLVRGGGHGLGAATTDGTAGTVRHLLFAKKAWCDGAGVKLAGRWRMTQRHSNLFAWQRADDLFVEVHRLTRGFPADERFELCSQIRRAAYSVPANIVEGFARRSRKERLHYLNIAEASLAEVGYCLHVARRLGYIDAATYETIDTHARQAAAPLVGLIRKG